MAHIELESLSDRELLILVVQATNDITDKLNEQNHCIDDHEARLIKLESSKTILPFSTNKTIIGLLTAVITLIGTLIAILAS